MSSYVPTDWVDGTTPLDAAHFDNMEAELVLLDALKVPDPAGLDEKWLKVEGGAMLWVDPPAGGGGGGLDWEGAWAGATPYVKGDVVTYNGVVYGAVNDSTGQTPPAAQAAPGVLPVIPLVTALPATPFDGQEVILCDSLTAPTYQWRLRHVAAKATNKWIYLGGQGLLASVFDQQSTTSSSAVDLATVGPGVTVPVAGTYRAEFRVRCTQTSGAPFLTVFLKAGAAAATPIVQSQGPVAHYTQYAKIDVAALAGDFVKLMYCSSAGIQGYFGERMLEVTPVAVGG